MKNVSINSCIDLKVSKENPLSHSIVDSNNNISHFFNHKEMQIYLFRIYPRYFFVVLSEWLCKIQHRSMREVHLVYFKEKGDTLE